MAVHALCRQCWDQSLEEAPRRMCCNAQKMWICFHVNYYRVGLFILHRNLLWENFVGTVERAWDVKFKCAVVIHTSFWCHLVVILDTYQWSDWLRRTRCCLPVYSERHKDLVTSKDIHPCQREWDTCKFVTAEVSLRSTCTQHTFWCTSGGFTGFSIWSQALQIHKGKWVCPCVSQWLASHAQHGVEYAGLTV